MPNMLLVVIADPAATAPEKANAEALKQRLEQRLRAAEPPSSGGWTDKAFRLGQWVKEMRKSAPPANRCVAKLEIKR